MTSPPAMTREAARWIAAGGLLAGLGVAAGAFGAHGLSGRLSPGALETFDTAARYHLVHAVALVLTGLAAQQAPHRGWSVAAWFFVVGIAVFGGTLYALALSGAGWLGAITPLGGLCFLAGWAVLARTAWSLRTADATDAAGATDADATGAAGATDASERS